MSGDPGKAGLWPDADVYVAAVDAETPTIADPFGVEWDLIGLLDGEAGFVQSRDEEVDDHYAWGGILVRTSRRNYKQTVTFSALEDNAVTRDLIWPASPAGQIVVPRPARVKVAFELREDDKVKRLITAYEAEVSLNADTTDAEGDLTRYELLVTVFPDADGRLFFEQHGTTSIVDPLDGSDGPGLRGDLVWGATDFFDEAFGVEIVGGVAQFYVEGPTTGMEDIAVPVPAVTSPDVRVQLEITEIDVTDPGSSYWCGVGIMSRLKISDDGTDYRQIGVEFGKNNQLVAGVPLWHAVVWQIDAAGAGGTVIGVATQATLAQLVLPATLTFEIVGDAWACKVTHAGPGPALFDSDTNADAYLDGTVGIGVGHVVIDAASYVNGKFRNFSAEAIDAITLTP